MGFKRLNHVLYATSVICDLQKSQISSHAWLKDSTLPSSKQTSHLRWAHVKPVHSYLPVKSPTITLSDLDSLLISAFSIKFSAGKLSKQNRIPILRLPYGIMTVCSHYTIGSVAFQIFFRLFFRFLVWKKRHYFLCLIFLAPQFIPYFYENENLFTKIPEKFFIFRPPLHEKFC